MEPILLTGLSMSTILRIIAGNRDLGEFEIVRIRLNV